MNSELFLTLNSFAGRYWPVDYLAIFLAELLIFFLIAASTIVIFKIVRWQGLLLLFISIILSFVFSLIIGVFFFEARPGVLYQINQLTQTLDPFSFPSKHATVAAAVAVNVYSVNHRLGYWVFGLAVLIGTARVFTGVHYPTDIIAGLIVGIITSSLVLKVSKV